MERIDTNDSTSVEGTEMLGKTRRLAVTTATGISIAGPGAQRAADVLTPEALDFVALLQRELDPRRRELLAARAERLERLRGGELPDFLPETQAVRDGDWRVPEAPADLRQRRVEITGPVDRKMMINALNSGASVFMADFEDANSPTWGNVVDGQANLIDAVAGTISLEQNGKSYSLGERTATLLVRPRGWHLLEKHASVGDAAVSASLFDFGLFVFHCARPLLESGSGPYLYLPKLESHREAALWHDAFTLAEEELGLGKGSIRATVLIETILAAFEMDEILHALGEHATGLNAGRWDYIFSVIKKLGDREEFVLPDRGDVTMAVPFMRAYADLLVHTCHRRGAHAIGGMAAFIPSRRDPEVNEIALAKVGEDKQRESGQGFDGTWVAHPDLVPVALPFFERENQLDVLREDVTPNAAALLDVRSIPGDVTDAGLRQNVSVGIQYIASWLNGVGAAAIFNLMEDAATAEISRSQVWQWLRQGRVSRDDVRATIEDETAKLEGAARLDEARELFEQVALSDEFVEFLTIPAYEHID
jgi:malate synthase